MKAKIINYVKENSESVVECLAIFLLFSGLVLGVFLVIKIIFWHYVVNETEIKLLGILLAGGLLGSVLNFVLEKLVYDYIKKYVKHKLEAYVDEIIDENIGEKEDEKRKAGLIENSSNFGVDFDTVIVPVAKSYYDVIKYLRYECPGDYKFKKGLKYMAFYKDKQILGWGEILGNYDPQNGKRVFNFKEIEYKVIPHLERGAFVQGKMYCSMDKLKKALNTSEVRDKKAEFI